MKINRGDVVILRPHRVSSLFQNSAYPYVVLTTVPLVLIGDTKFGGASGMRSYDSLPNGSTVLGLPFWIRWGLLLFLLCKTILSA